MKIIDISLPLYEGMITYPGNPDVKITSVKGETTDRSDVFFGTHTGTHIDAPRHAFKKGKGVDKLPLGDFVGPCRVLDFSKVKEVVTVEDLRAHKIKKGERILVKTSNSKRGFKKFYDDYVYLDGDAADFLAEKKITLFGIDALSVKKRGGSDTRPHDSLLKRDIIILEGIDLAKVRQGQYVLSALPLRFVGLDGSPVRAILMPI